MGLPMELRWQIYTYLLRPGDRLIIEDWLLANLPCKDLDVPVRTVYMFRQPSSRLRIESSSALATYKRCCYPAHRSLYGQELKIHTNIMSVNRQVRDETLPCLYGQHLHFACSPDGVEAFLKDRSDTARCSIKHITLAIPSETGRMTFESLCSLITRELQLEKLSVRINTFWWECDPFQSIRSGNCAMKDFWTLDWVQSLLLLKHLDTVDIVHNDWCVAEGHSIGAQFTKMLQARMLGRDIHNRAQLDDELQEVPHHAVSRS